MDIANPVYLTPRRSSYSRKAQLSLFASYVVAIVGAITGLILAIFSVADPAGFSMFRVAAIEIAASPARGAHTVIASLSRASYIVSAYIAAGSQNLELRQRLAESQRLLIAASRLSDENRQLRTLVQLQEQEGAAVANGYLLSSTPTSSRRIVMMNIGTNDNVQQGMPVRSADGLIGRVLDVGPYSSRLLLLTDSSNIVPVRRASDGLPATSSGRGDGDVEIKTLDIANNPFEFGDILVTSGTGGVYRPNIPVAIVVSHISDGAIARPLANPAKNDIVSILPIYDHTDSSHLFLSDSLWP